LAVASLRRNTLHMLGAHLCSALFQGLQFILIARALGALEFGRMAGVLAITSALLPFSGLGSSNVLMMRVARAEGLATLYLGNALMVAAVSGSLLIALAALAGPAFLRAPSALPLILLLGASELLTSKIIEICAHVFYGRDQHAFSGAFFSIQAAVRLCAAALFSSLFSEHGLVLWAWMHLGAGTLAALVALRVTVGQVGRPSLDIGLALRELKVGVHFAIGSSASSIYTDIDKAVLARYASSEINGQYTAAYRLIFMAYAPVMAVLMATQGMFFRAGGTSGLSATIKLAIRVAWLGCAYCLALAALLYLGAPLVAWALGPQYIPSTDILRTLALLPLVLMAQSVFSEALTGANKQRARSFAQVGVAILCFALNMTLIPSMGWHGAVVATYICQTTLAAMVIWIIWHSARAEARS
jgi:O-antigen/teichoic acid export membrane protein